MNPVRLLVTSAGSLLGQNILDVLEPRRDQVHLSATTDNANNPRLYRCDTVYMVPPTSQREAFEGRVLDIIAEERPDLVIAARDPDILIQSGWRESRPDLIPILTAGSMEAGMIMQDKLLSYHFASERGLPFARTAVCGPGGDLRPVHELAKICGYPLLAKPRGGYGSLGVALVLDDTQLEDFRGDTGYIFQHYLDPPSDLEERLRPLRRGVPLFFSLPETRVHVCQTTIAPNGDIAPIFCMRAELIVGRSEYHEKVDDPELADLGRRYAVALAEIGWVGPLNLQSKRSSAGGFAAFEMNGRMSGGSSARTLMGFDEMAILARLFLGEGRLPTLPSPPKSCRRVIKSLVDGMLDDANVDELQRAGVWRRGCHVSS